MLVVAIVPPLRIDTLKLLAEVVNVPAIDTESVKLSAPAVLPVVLTLLKALLSDATVCVPVPSKTTVPPLFVNVPPVFVQVPNTLKLPDGAVNVPPLIKTFPLTSKEPVVAVIEPLSICKLLVVVSVPVPVVADPLVTVNEATVSLLPLRSKIPPATVTALPSAITPAAPNCNVPALIVVVPV